jgi:hypothetical protein
LIDKIIQFLAKIPDQSPKRKSRHGQEEILTMFVVAVIAGKASLREIHDFCEDRLFLFKEFFPGIKSVPSKDDFDRTIEGTAGPSLFDGMFQELGLDFLRRAGGRNGPVSTKKGDRDTIYVDGRTSSGTELRPDPKSRLQILNAQAGPTIMAHMAVWEKPGDNTAVPGLIREIQAHCGLKGKTVAMGALGCHGETVSLIREFGGDYVICPQDGKGLGLGQEVRALLQDGLAGTETLSSDWDKARGHIERWSLAMIPLSPEVARERLPSAQGWEGLRVAALLTREKLPAKGDGELKAVSRPFVSSLAPLAGEMLGAARGLSQAEPVPKVLYRVYGKDQGGIGQVNGHGLFTLARMLGLNLIRPLIARNPGDSFDTLLRFMVWRPDYLLAVLRENPEDMLPVLEWTGTHRFDGEFYR